MSTPDADELGKTAPLELPQQPPPAPSPPPVEPPVEDGELTTAEPPVADAVVAVPAHTEVVYREPREEVVYVPLAITIGDGFKFGCGFFLALVLAMLVGFVLVAALFLLTTLFGLNLPITR